MRREAICICCGGVYISNHGSRKLCDYCRCATPAQRDKLMKEGPKAKEQLKGNCEMCGREMLMSSRRQKWCPDCREAAYAKTAQECKARKKLKTGAKSKAEKERDILLDWHDLSKKSLRRVDAEAKAFGLSYGQYTAAVRSGVIDAKLKEKGIEDPEAILRGIDVK